MGKLFALLAMLFFVANLATAHAQKEYATKGVFEFGGSIYFYSGETEEEDMGVKVADVTYRETAVIPGVGYFVTDSLYLGGGVLLARGFYEREWVKGREETSEGSKIAFFFTPTFVAKIKGVNVYPFVGAFIGGGTLEEKEEERVLGLPPWKYEEEGSFIECGIQGGLKFKVIEGGLLNVGLRTTSEGHTLSICGFSLYR